MKSRSLTSALLACFLLQTAWADANETPTLAGFDASYEVRWGALRADVDMTMDRDGNTDEYVFRVTSEARGLARLLRSGTGIEEARFRFTNGEITPLTYSIDDGTKAGEDNNDIRFDWANDVAFSTYEDGTVELPLAPDIRDRLSTDAMLMMKMANGGPPETFRIADKGRVRDYEIRLLGEETVEVPAGTFRALKYHRQRVGSSRSQLIWFAPDVNYLPVRIEQLKRGKSSVTTVATRIEVEAIT